MGSGGRCDHCCRILRKSVKGFRSYRTPQTPFLILNVLRPYNSVSTTVLHCDITSYSERQCYNFIMKSFNSYFLTPEKEDQSLLCSLDSCDVQTPSEFGFPSPGICSVLPGAPSPLAPSRFDAPPPRALSPTIDGNTSVLL